MAAVAAHGLASAPTSAPILLSSFEFTAFLSACEEHRLLGLLAEAVRDGQVVLDEPQREMLERRLLDWLQHDLVVESTLLRALDVLAAHGMDHRVLKGIALANSVYAEPSQRVFGDVDLLVAPAQFSAAAHWLADELGAARELPELRPGFDDRFGREILLRLGPVELDLHRTLVDGPFGLSIPLSDLFSCVTRFTLGGREVHGLGVAERFVHGCLSAVLGDWPPRLIALRDVAEMLVADAPGSRLDGRNALDLAQRWRAVSVVARAVVGIQEYLGVRIDHPLVDWAHSYRPSIRDRLVLAAYRGRGRGYTSQALSVLAIEGWRNRWDYLAAIVRPTPAYLQARRFRRGDRLRRALGLRRRSRK